MPKKETQATRERRWQAEEDARTLTQVEEINGDAKRLKRAQAEAKKLAERKRKELIAIEKVAKKPVNSKIKRGDGKMIRIKSNRDYH